MRLWKVRHTLVGCPRVGVHVLPFKHGRRRVQGSEIAGSGVGFQRRAPAPAVDTAVLPRRLQGPRKTIDVIYSATVLGFFWSATMNTRIFARVSVLGFRDVE